MFVLSFTVDIDNISDNNDNDNVLGTGLGSVSMMTRLCDNGAAVSKKKYRFEALAASRDKRIDTDSDSDDQIGENDNDKIQAVTKL